MTAVTLAGPLRAQVVPGSGVGAGTLAADRARVAQIRPPRDSAGLPAVEVRDTADRWVVRGIAPTVRLVVNSALPDGGNDGALWAGRGTNLGITGGVALHRRTDAGALQLRLAPELAYSQNRPFPVYAGRVATRSAFSSPWHLLDASADLPLRFGDQPLSSIGLGESSIELVGSRVAAGLSAATEWWGPAIHNTLLLSNNAGGVPRAFVRTARPVRTRAGELEARLMLGTLRESMFFDYDEANDTRAISGVLVTFRPAIDAGLTLGVARLVVSPVSGGARLLEHGLDALTRFEPLAERADTTATGASRRRGDQLLSLFARWVFPASGVEAYGEWARTSLPRSLRAALAEPRNGAGYTLGLQWADPAPVAGFLRLLGEATYLEQTPVNPDRMPPDFYTGRVAPQGFTQRGQVLGAMVGPGGSTQLVAADWVTRRWQAGLFAGRTRTENDALYRQLEPREIQHDVTLFGGVRAGGSIAGRDLLGQLRIGRRLNYLFQNDGLLGEPRAMDIRNVSLSLVVSPH